MAIRAGTREKHSVLILNTDETSKLTTFQSMPLDVLAEHGATEPDEVSLAGSAADGDASKQVARVRDLHVTLTRGRDHVHALRGVNLDVHRGEILGLVGESGSGKSVLALALQGLLPAGSSPVLSGSANVCGLEVVGANARSTRRLRASHIGSVFQDPMSSLNPTMRVGKQLREVCGSTDEAVSLLDRVGVPEPRRRLRAFPHELSGGLRQRVMIAMAISGNPALIVADEPTTALDVTVQAQILTLLRELADGSGTSILLVTHDLGVAAQVTDRLAVLYAGRFAETGPTSKVLGDPQHPYTAGLLRSRIGMTTRRDQPLQTLEGELPNPRHPSAGCPFGPRCVHRTDVCDHLPPPLVPTSATRESACVRLTDLGGSVPVAAPTRERESHDVWSDPAGLSDDRRPVLTVRGAAKQFPTRVPGQGRRMLHALRGVDLTVGRGEAVAVVGESGSGKSTLLRAIAGLGAPDAGEISMRGPGAAQIVFQDAGSSLTPWLSVGDLVGEPLRAAKVSRAQRRARVAESLGLVGLPSHIVDIKPGSLSGGQRQRVALARAIAVPPAVLLCDEPTSALDVSLAATVLNLIGQLRRELGLAIVFVTHDLAAARLVSDRIAVMYLGQIVEEGPSELVCSQPAHPYTRTLMAAIPEIGRPMAAILAGDPASALDPPTGCSFHPRCEFAVGTCRTETPPLVNSDEPGHMHSCAVNPARTVKMTEA
jgi:peptide/nickel transport system ATP-binding protein